MVQMVLTEMLDGGYLEKHLRRVQKAVCKPSDCFDSRAEKAPWNFSLKFAMKVPVTISFFTITEFPASEH